MRRKRKKEVTSETAFCSSQKKRRYIFCRKSFLPQNTKYLKGKKRQQLKQPVLMKHITEKKQPVLGIHMRRKGKREVTSDTVFSFTMKKQKISVVENHFLPQNTKYLKGKKRQYLKRPVLMICMK